MIILQKKDFTPKNAVKTFIMCAEEAGVYDRVDFGEVEFVLTRRQHYAAVKSVRRQRLWTFAEELILNVMEVFDIPTVSIMSHGTQLNFYKNGHFGGGIWSDGNYTSQDDLIVFNYTPTPCEVYKMIKFLFKSHFDYVAEEKSKDMDIQAFSIASKQVAKLLCNI